MATINKVIPLKDNPILNKKKINRTSINAENVAKKVVEKMSKGEKVVLGEIMKDVGYSDSLSAQPIRVTSQPSFKAIVTPYIDRMKSLRDRTLDALATKDLPAEKMFDLNNLLKTLNHDTQLLEGKATENVAHKTAVVVFGSDDFLALQMNKGVAISGGNITPQVSDSVNTDWTDPQL